MSVIFPVIVVDKKDRTEAEFWFQRFELDQLVFLRDVLRRRGKSELAVDGRAIVDTAVQKFTHSFVLVPAQVTVEEELLALRRPVAFLTVRCEPTHSGPSLYSLVAEVLETAPEYDESYRLAKGICAAALTLFGRLLIPGGGGSKYVNEIYRGVDLDMSYGAAEKQRLLQNAFEPPGGSLQMSVSAVMPDREVFVFSRDLLEEVR